MEKAAEATAIGSRGWPMAGSGWQRKQSWSIWIKQQQQQQQQESSSVYGTSVEVCVCECKWLDFGGLLDGHGERLRRGRRRARRHFDGVQGLRMLSIDLLNDWYELEQLEEHVWLV